MISAWWLILAAVVLLAIFAFLAETAPTLDYMNDSEDVQR